MNVAQEACAHVDLKDPDRLGLFFGYGGLRAYWNELIPAFEQQSMDGADCWERGFKLFRATLGGIMKNPALVDESIEDTVREIVAAALAMDVEKVHLNTSLMDELGAESLDYLDIVFKLERAFDIEITRGEMERAARGEMLEEEFASGGVISEAGLARLREIMPEAADQIKSGLRPIQILSFFTVRTFVNLVIGKRAGKTA